MHFHGQIIWHFLNKCAKHKNFKNKCQTHTNSVPLWLNFYETNHAATLSTSLQQSDPLKGLFRKGEDIDQCETDWGRRIPVGEEMREEVKRRQRRGRRLGGEKCVTSQIRLRNLWWSSQEDWFQWGWVENHVWLKIKYWKEEEADIHIYKYSKVMTIY